MPYVFARRLGEDIRFFHAHNLAGIDFDSIAGHWSTQGINYYVAAEMVTRPDAEVEMVLQEYYGAFGPASGAVGAYFDHWERVARRGPALMREHGLVLNETWGGWWPAFVRLAPLLYTEEVLAAGEEHLRRAELLAAADRPVFRDRVALLRAGFEHARLTARVVADAVAAQTGGDDARRAARDSQAALRAFRGKLLQTHPLAVEPAYLMRMERRRDLMWMEAPPAVAAGEPLPGPWRFSFDPHGTGVSSGWYREEMDDGAWEPIAVETWWQQQPPGLRWHAEHGTHYEGVAWYRTEFDVAFREETDVHEGDRVTLHFGAVDAAARVWVNGIEVMDRPYPYQGDKDSWKTPFAVDVTGQVRPGRPNRLAVRVDAVSGMGGIWRPVHVEVQPRSAAAKAPPVSR